MVGVLQWWILYRQGTLLDIEGRPWVGLDHIADGGMTAGQKLTIFAALRKSGGTPALHVQTCVGSKVIEDYQIDRWIAKVMDELKTCRHIASFYVLPNAASYMDVSRKSELMTRDVVTNLTTGVEVLVAFGRVTYNTASGEQHWTTFCSVFVPSGNFFHACEYGNDAE